MKFEKVKYTAQYEGIHKTNEWISIDVILEGEETPETGLDAAKQKIEGWHGKGNSTAPAGEIPVINRRDETLLALIEDAKNMDELNNYHAPAQSSNNAKIMEAYAIKVNSFKKSKQ